MDNVQGIQRECNESMRMNEELWKQVRIMEKCWKQSHHDNRKDGKSVTDWKLDCFKDNCTENLNSPEIGQTHTA